MQVGQKRCVARLVPMLTVKVGHIGARPTELHTKLPPGDQFSEGSGRAERFFELEQAVVVPR
jgi:hypothetical protein